MNDRGHCTVGGLLLQWGTTNEKGDIIIEKSVNYPMIYLARRPHQLFCWKSPTRCTVGVANVHYLVIGIEILGETISVEDPYDRAMKGIGL